MQINLGDLKGQGQMKVTFSRRLKAAVSAAFHQEPVAVAFRRSVQLEIEQFDLHPTGRRSQSLDDVDAVDTRRVRQRVARALQVKGHRLDYHVAHVRLSCHTSHFTCQF